MSRKATERTETRDLRTEVRDVVRDSVALKLRDTLKEVTTVTVQLNEAGDTVRVAQVTDRTTVRDRSRASAVRERVEVRIDTVYVLRDVSETVVAAGPGVEVGADGSVSAGGAGFRSSLKWIFLILLVLLALVLVVLFGLRKVSL